MSTCIWENELGLLLTGWSQKSSRIERIEEKAANATGARGASTVAFFRVSWSMIKGSKEGLCHERPGQGHLRTKGVCNEWLDESGNSFYIFLHHFPPRLPRPLPCFSPKSQRKVFILYDFFSSNVKSEIKEGTSQIFWGLVFIYLSFVYFVHMRMCHMSSQENCTTDKIRCHQWAPSFSDEEFIAGCQHHGGLKTVLFETLIH